MTWPEFTVSQMRNKLYDEIIAELSILFGHSQTDAAELFERYREKYPQLDEDYYRHEGPFPAALRIHYDLVLGGNTSEIEFLEWRKQFWPIARDRKK